MGLDKNGYWSPRELLGYNCRYNVILSDRGRGKSWAIKHMLVDSDLPFMCLYRTVADLDAAVQSWADVFEDGARFKWIRNKNGPYLAVDGEIRGWFRALSQVNHVKQEVFPDTMKWVWLDEFIPMAYKKIPGVASEGDAIRTIVKTIEHDSVTSRGDKGLSRVRVLMVGNPMTWDNPLLSYFHINGLLGYGCHRAGPDVAWEWLPPLDVERSEAMLGADVHQAAAGIKSASAYVRKVPKGVPLWMSVRLGSDFFRIYRQRAEFYVQRSAGHVEGYEYGTLDGLRECEICVDDTSSWRVLKKFVQQGHVWFDDVSTKYLFINHL